MASQWRAFRQAHSGADQGITADQRYGTSHFLPLGVPRTAGPPLRTIFVLARFQRSRQQSSHEGFASAGPETVTPLSAKRIPHGTEAFGINRVTKERMASAWPEHAKSLKSQPRSEMEQALEIGVSQDSLAERSKAMA